MRVGKMLLAWAVALLMAVDSASACRWGWSYGSPAPRYYSAYTSCGPVVSYSAADCPICARARGAPVTTNRVPSAPPSTPTPQPTLEPAPGAAQPPAAEPPPAFEPLPPFEPSAPGETQPAAEPQPLEPFAPPTEEMPPEEPAPKPADDIEDLFKEPAPAAAPADDVEDLFKQPAPGDAPAQPAEEPTKPADDVEDLFQDPGAPAADEPAKPADDVDDLFKDVDNNNAAAAGALAETKPKASDREIEELFSGPSAEVPNNASDDEIKALQDEVDKLFAVSAPAEEENSGAMRLWTDNTGKYHVRARLAVVGAAHVRLLKENGKYTTVPFERLSRDDLAFVQRHADHAIAASF